MSDVPDGRGQLDLRAELARIDRERAETQKLMLESEKFIAEQRARLIAESGRDRWLTPLLFLLASISGGLIVAIATHACR